MDFSDYIPFKQGLKELPGSPHLSAGYRFIKKGCRGVKLQTVLVGGRRYVSRTALQAFVEAVTRTDNDADRPSSQPNDSATISAQLDAENL